MGLLFWNTGELSTVPSGGLLERYINVPVKSSSVKGNGLLLSVTAAFHKIDDDHYGNDPSNASHDGNNYYSSQLTS